MEQHKVDGAPQNSSYIKICKKNEQIFCATCEKLVKTYKLGHLQPQHPPYVACNGDACEDAVNQDSPKQDTLMQNLSTAALIFCLWLVAAAWGE